MHCAVKSKGLISADGIFCANTVSFIILIIILHLRATCNDMKIFNNNSHVLLSRVESRGTEIQTCLAREVPKKPSWMGGYTSELIKAAAHLRVTDKQISSSIANG